MTLFLQGAILNVEFWTRLVVILENVSNIFDTWKFLLFKC